MIKIKHVIDYQGYKTSNVAFGKNVRFNCCGEFDFLKRRSFLFRKCALLETIRRIT